ncbi:MAG: hypothetical protein ACREJ2_12730, partial [Planctomycetota bacterium]
PSAALDTTALDEAAIRRRLVRPEDPGSFGLSAVLHEPAAQTPADPAAATAATTTGARADWALLVPGWAGDRCGPGEIFLPLAADLLAAPDLPIGRVLRFDVRGRGEAPGDFAASDLDAMVDDGLYALALAAALVGASPTAPVRVHLIGMCSGGNVALGVAGLWQRLQAGDEQDLRHLAPAALARLRAVTLASVQAVSTFPFQEMRPAELNAIRRGENRRKTIAKLFRADSYKKLFTGKLNPTRILKNWFEAEPGAASGTAATSAAATKASAGTGSSATAPTDGAPPVNRKQSRRDLLEGLAQFAQAHAHALQFLYADGDPEGVASIPVYKAFFQALPAAPKFVTLPGCNHNFYGAPARAHLFPALLRTVRVSDRA